jgi:hypothetical protein
METFCLTDKKSCTRCNVEKNLNEFHVNSANKDKRCNICKLCVNTLNKEKTAKRILDPNQMISCSKCKTKKHKDNFTGSPTKTGLYKVCSACRNSSRSINEKACSCCGKVKEVSSFTKSRSTKDGYSSNCKDCQKVYFCEYNKNNKGRKKDYDKSRYLEKREEIRKKSKEYYIENREKIIKKQRDWASKNTPMVRRQSSEKRARKRNSMPPWLNESHKKEISNMHLLAKALERETGKVFHVDHIIPLKHNKMCGLHVPWNLRVITEGENMAKNNKFCPELGLTAC